MNSQVADPIIKKKVGMEGEGGRFIDRNWGLLARQYEKTNAHAQVMGFYFK